MMRPARPRSPVDLPLSARDRLADTAADSGVQFEIEPVRRDPTDPEGRHWTLCDESEAEVWGLYKRERRGVDRLAIWISDHASRADAERARAAAEREHAT